MPVFSILVPPRPVMICLMAFCSNDRLSSSPSSARAAPAIARPIPTITVVSRRERFNAPDERCRAQPNSVSRIVCILFKSLANCALCMSVSQVTTVARSLAYRLGSGRFYGGCAEEGVIQQRCHTSNDGDIGDVEDV